MQKLLAASIIAIAIAGPVHAESAKTPDATGSVSFMAVQGQSEMRASQWIGAAVKNNADEEIGDVNDFVIGPDGRISAVVTGVGGFLGVGEKNVALPFSSVKMTTTADEQRIVMVDTTREALAAAPAFRKLGQKTVQDRVDDASKAAKKGYEAAKESVKKGLDTASETVKEGYEAAKENLAEGSKEKPSATAQ